MKTCHYIGDHAADSWLVRAGWGVTRVVQKGPFGHVTHVEAIHAEHADGSVTIASASVRDEGVRAKRVMLNPAHWLVLDVPQWDVQRSIELLEATQGLPYDWRGAIATAFLGSQDNTRWFCNEWVAYPFLRSPATFGPHHFAAICLSFGRDTTADFFGSRAHA